LGLRDNDRSADSNPEPDEVSSAAMYVWHGPEDSPHFLVLAPGDQGRLSDVAPTVIAEGLGEAGIRVVRFAFPPCEDKDDVVRDALLAEHIRQAATQRAPRQRLILAGLSRGARMGGALVSELGAAGLLAFAYPFHARHDPDPGPRLKALSDVPTPVLICQGTRDSHGNKEQVRGYRLPTHIRVHWLEDANHALTPRARSGQTQTEQLAEAVTIAAAFVNALS
jgi:predicted alpha/beta-hydrolase family hydrolase